MSMRGACGAFVLLGACTIDRDPFEPTIDAGENTGMIVANMASITVQEMQTGTLGVFLSASPPNPVTVTIDVGDVSVANVSPSSVFFDFNSYSTPRPITVTGRMDPDALSENTVITLSASGYATVPVPAMVTDDDMLGIQSSPSNTGQVFEGATAMLHVTLTAQPLSVVTVDAASNNVGKLTLIPPSLVFDDTNWNLEQIVTVSGVEDADLTNDSAMVTLSATGLPMKSIAYTVLDND